jgi:hypothetical protein
MRPEFLQTSHDHLGQVALAITVGDLDGFVQLAFAQGPGHGRSELPRLTAGPIVGNQTVDHDANRPCRHNKEHDHHESGQPAHHRPHRARVEVTPRPLPLKKHKRPNLQL